jgi:hypothetical protein
MMHEPEIPLLPTLYFEDVTQEALALSLAHGWPSASLWSDEAGIIIGSQSMQSNPTRFVAVSQVTKKYKAVYYVGKSIVLNGNCGIRGEKVARYIEES